MNTPAISLAILLFFFLTSTYAAADDADELRSMVLLLSAQVTDLQQRLQSLEHDKTVQRTEIASLKVHAKDSHWTEKLEYKGDFRYRYDRYDDARSDNDRHRDRLRARAHITATLDDKTKVGLGVATGDEDPISTNQTLGSLSSTKDLRLDLAWFQWQITEELLWKGGKIENPVHRVGGHFLLWNSDPRPEGMNVIYSQDKLHATAGHDPL